MEAIKCKEINFTYPNVMQQALSNVSFTVEQGEICLLFGASAAGKSTLLQLMKKEIAPAGTLTGTLDISGSTGYVSQHIEEAIVCDTVRSELSFGLTNLGFDAEKTELLVAEAASYFNLEPLLNVKVSELSGGEKQVVCLASVMLMKPDVLLLDEPCARLDPVASEHFIRLIEKLNRDFHTTVMISEHSEESVFSMADSMAFLEAGKLLLKAPMEAAVTELLRQEHPMRAALPVTRRMTGKYTVLPAHALPKADTALTAKGLRFAYEKGKDILQTLDISVYRGRMNAVIGANGSGKSTLLKVLCGVSKPYHGKVRANGKTAMLTQHVFDLFTKERCGDEVTFGTVTDALRIADIEERHPYDLSGGQAQRLALAMVLAQEADILLLDEPTAGLDALAKEQLATLLQSLCAAGKTVLLVSHDIEFVGAYCQHISFLSEGRLVMTGERRTFFSALRFYTTAVARMTDGAAVSLDDLEFV